MNDLILTCLNSQYEYVHPRIHSSKMALDFSDQMLYFIREYQLNQDDTEFQLSMDDLYPWLGNKAGTNLAISVTQDIIQCIENRFDNNF